MTKDQRKTIKKQDKLGKDILNIIRTTMRNNVELTTIADNKANVLLSVNALMITFLLPFVFPNMDLIEEYNLIVPLALLTLTSFVVIYISALVLKPSKFYERYKEIKQGRLVSPFFFGNYYKMDLSEFRVYIKGALSKEGLVRGHIVDDLHYIGSRLGQKMSLLRLAFNIFIIGFFSSVAFAFILLYINQR